MVTGAISFIEEYAAINATGQAAFFADFPQKILPIELDPGCSVSLHKHAFICAESSVGSDLIFTKSF